MTTPVPAPPNRATAVHLWQVVPHAGAPGVVPVPAGLVALGHIGSPIASTSSGTFGVPFAVHLSGFLVTTQNAQSGVRLVTPSRSEPPISTPLKSAISAGPRPIDGAVSLDTITPRNEIGSEEATLDQAADDGAPQVLVPPLTAPARVADSAEQQTRPPKPRAAVRQAASKFPRARSTWPCPWRRTQTTKARRRSSRRLLASRCRRPPWCPVFP